MLLVLVFSTSIAGCSVCAPTVTEALSLRRTTSSASNTEKCVADAHAITNELHSAIDSQVDADSVSAGVNRRQQALEERLKGSNYAICYDADTGKKVLPDRE